MAADDLGEGPAEGLDVQAALEPDGDGDVVGGAAGLEPVEEPEPLLGEGGGQGAGAVGPLDGRGGGVAVGQGPLDQSGEVREGRPLDEVLQRDLDVEEVADRGRGAGWP